MRAFIASAIAFVAVSAKVHEYPAEANFICEMCQKAVNLANDGKDDELESLYELFPALQTRVNSFFAVRNEIVDLTAPHSTCEAMKMCESEDYTTMFLREQPQDLDSIVEYVNNNPKSTWKAAKPSKFDGASINEVRKMMGTIVDPEWRISLRPKTYNTNDTDLPYHFDARENWPECEDVINHVRDQSECGSCWAHGTTEALNDRMCIASGGSFQTLLSVSDTTACCDARHCFSFGCNGGQVATPWAWFASKGVVTGGDYGDNSLCYAYTMPKCAHHVAPSEGMVDCSEVAEVDPICDASCPSNTAIEYATDKKFGTSSYGITGVDNIKTEISTYGSITAALTVYEDFEAYSSGVYVH
jgi:cathepsin B